MPRKLPDLRKVFERLIDHQVEFIVIGGVSAILQGVPVVTLDLDIVHARTSDNAQRLEAALQELGAYYREHPDWKPIPNASLLQGRGHHLLSVSDGYLDILGSVTGGRGYGELLVESDEIGFQEGLTVRVISLEMLIRLKEETGRERDLMVLPLLRAALEERHKLHPGDA